MGAIFLHQSRVLRAWAVRTVRRVLLPHVLDHGLKHVLIHVLGVVVVSGVRLQDEDAVVVGRGVCRRRWVVPRCWRRAPDLQNLYLLARILFSISGVPT